MDDCFQLPTPAGNHRHANGWNFPGTYGNR
jgi:hypothetical protein